MGWASLAEVSADVNSTSTANHSAKAEATEDKAKEGASSLLEERAEKTSPLLPGTTQMDTALSTKHCNFDSPGFDSYMPPHPQPAGLAGPAFNSPLPYGGNSGPTPPHMMRKPRPMNPSMGPPMAPPPMAPPMGVPVGPMGAPISTPMRPPPPGPALNAPPLYGPAPGQGYGPYASGRPPSSAYARGYGAPPGYGDGPSGALPSDMRVSVDYAGLAQSGRPLANGIPEAQPQQ